MKQHVSRLTHRNQSDVPQHLLTAATERHGQQTLPQDLLYTLEKLSVSMQNLFISVVTLVIIAQVQTTRSPPADEGINEMWHICPMDYCSAVDRSEVQMDGK